VAQGRLNGQISTRLLFRGLAFSSNDFVGPPDRGCTCAEESTVTLTVGGIFLADETDLNRARASTDGPCPVTSIEELQALSRAK